MCRLLRERTLREWALRGCVIGLALVLAPSAPAGAADLNLKRVMLSSGGVGYFEYEATVEGDATVTLDVALDQVDDVLKSLVVYDDGGRAGEITLPGREPLAKSFADLPFDQSALASATALLNALQGSEIRIGGDKPLAGRLMHAEDAAEHRPDGASETRTRISVLTDGGLRQATVKDLDSIEFADPAVQAQIKTALTRIAAYRAPGRRQLTLATHGSGRRTMRIGYVIGMPLWKATYRLSLPGDANAGSARLQGWAVLENFSGQAWKDVELTLLSGSPVTFRQALYQSYYVPRQMVPVESGSRVLPPPDSGALQMEAARGDLKKSERDETKARNMASGLPASALAAPAPPPPMAPAQMEAAAASENATQVAFLLPYRVSVAAGQSLVVPLIDRELPTRRVDLYQPSTIASHPLAAIELTNAADTGLPPGVLTLYQQGDRGGEYLGDARLAAFPAGEKRLLSYAIDNKVTIANEFKSQQPIVKATIAEGIMHLTRLERATMIYQVHSAGAPPRLIIEQSQTSPDYRLTIPNPDQAERTPNGAYRIPAALDDKGNGTVTIVEERSLLQELRLVDLNDNQLGVYVAAKEIDPKVHQALAELLQRRQAVSRRQAELDRLTEDRSRLMEDETRLRDNYTALKDEPSMRKRTLDKLNEALTAIDANAAGIAKATAAVAAAQSDLAGHVSGLKQ